MCRIRCCNCMREFKDETELLKVRETSYLTGKIEHREDDTKPLINTNECWEEVIDACPDCMTDEFLMDLI